MRRPCFLVVDHEYPASISSRKLVLETAKFNVITAYSSPEALETLRRFPAIDGIVLNAHIGDVPCQELVGQLRAMNGTMPIVLTSASGDAYCEGVTDHVRSFDPKQLLETLQNICKAETVELADYERSMNEEKEMDD